MTPTRSTAVAVFDDRESAEEALAELREAGFTDDQLGIATGDATPPAPGQQKPDEEPSKGDDGTGIGMLTGASLGGLAVGAAGMAATGGMILAGLLGGALVGGLLGTLIGMGVADEEAKVYEGEVKAGRTIVTVRADGRYEEALEIMRSSGGRDQGSSQP